LKNWEIPDFEVLGNTVFGSNGKYQSVKYWEIPDFEVAYSKIQYFEVLANTGF